MDFINLLLKGILLGAGAILPGISSGVLCVIFGLYEPIIDSILNFFKRLKKNLSFLFPLFFGIFIGIVILGNVLKYLFFAYPMQIKYLFMGLIIGSIPSVIRHSIQKVTFKPYYLLFTIISFIFGIVLVFLEKNCTLVTSINHNFLFIFFSGFIMSAGVVIPGVSSTLILMILGIYEPYLSAISTINIYFLFPLGLGIFTGSILLMKLTKILFEKFYAQTFFSIIGFTLSSVLVLYPGFIFNLTGLISALCFILALSIVKLNQEK